ncbi:MAG: hypothetical protein COA47_07850 [Robiginitomaculum sp.]|nr:MAG: hypothetical protein COA47_07850 [Robiginitomaculum sp.]
MTFIRSILLLAALTFSAPAMAQNVAVISQEMALTTSKVGIYVGQQLQVIDNQIDAEFEPELVPLRAQAQQLNAEASALAPEVLRTRNDLMRREQDLRLKLGELANWKQRQMAASRNQALKPVLEAYQAAVNGVIADKKIDILFDGADILFRNKQSDITEAVVIKMDAALTTTSVARVRVPRVPPAAPAQGARR